MARLIPAIQTDLADDYYLQNFKKMLDSVCSLHSDVLSPQLQQFVARFQRAGRDAQQLYVRLVCRKPELFRREQLEYREISTTESAIAGLISLDLLKHAHTLSDNELLNCLRLDELKWLVRDLGGSKLPRKSDCLAWLNKQADMTAGYLSAWLTAKGISIFAVCDKVAVKQIQLLFFSSPRRDLSEFVLVQMGVQQFENYPLSAASQSISNAGELKVAFQLAGLLEQLDQTGTRKASLEQLQEWNLTLGSKPVRASLASKFWKRACAAVARQYERHQLAEQAIALYRQCDTLDCVHRLFRLLLQAGLLEQAQQLLSPLLGAKAMTAEQQLAQKLSRQLAKATGQKISRASPSGNNWSVITRTIDACMDGVEQAAINHLQKGGEEAHFVENFLFQTVCGLYFWQEIFADLPGAFSHPFQDAPHDLNSSQFYNARSGAIEAKLADIDSGTWCKSNLLRRYVAKEPLQNRLVHWRYISLPLLRRALRVIPDRHWYLILSRMIRDLPASRTGLPDLICFEQGGGYRLIEVKGPGDRLQDSQKRWLSYFSKHHIPAQELHVDWMDVRYSESS